ncbi:MAG: redoxin domain-containing protein [Deltaproteobacteria bacterium]|nr:redoxin domain-containing protein [Deltaproteobacteria bacterium]
MDVAITLLGARLLLAAVFCIAAVAKVADLKGTGQALFDFGVPRPLVSPLKFLLPLVELMVAGTLLFVSLAWWGAVGALSLLGLFSLAIAINLALGRQPDCHCFGQLHSAPAGWSTLLRNGLLTALAGALVWQGKDMPGLSLVTVFMHLTARETVALSITALVFLLFTLSGWLFFHILRQQGRLLLRIEVLEQRLNAPGQLPLSAPVQPTQGLPIGTLAPPFQLPGLYGETLTLDALRASGKPVLLLFSDPGCGPCNALLPELVPWQRDHSSELTIALISHGSREENQTKSIQHKLTNVLVQQDREVAMAYQSLGTPAAVLVSADGKIASPVAPGADAIRALIARAVGQPVIAQPPTAVPALNGHGHVPTPPQPVLAKIGDPAPTLALPDLHGKTINMTKVFKAGNTLVLFWNPGCGFCSQMLADLKAWESSPPAGAPQLLVVSTGAVESNRKMDLRSLVVLDEGFQVGRSFGAQGTPSGILVQDGKIASPLVVGAPAVLALARGEQGPTVIASH